MLLLPGWQDSDADHWQTAWQRLWGDQRVAQHDWLRPRRGDWCARLEAVVRDTPGPLALVAHSLGCHLVAAWAAASASTAKVHAALLVAPPDTEAPPLAQQLPGWAPMVRRRLSFASTVVASTDDPYCTLARAAGLAADWGSVCVPVGPCGHINSASALGDWPQGRAILQAMLDDNNPH